MCWLYLGNRAQDGSISWVSGTYLSMETALLCHLEAEFSSVLNEGVVFAASYLKALSIAQQMIPWTPVGICIWNRWQHKCRGTRTSDTHKAQDPQQKLSQHILHQGASDQESNGSANFYIKQEPWGCSETEGGYTRQQKRHWCIDQSFGLCGRGRGWEDLGE